MLIVRLGAALTGALPLTIHEHQRGGIRVRALNYLMVPDTQFCGFLALPGHEAVVADAVALWLINNARSWDRLDLGYTDPTDSGTNIFLQVLERYGLRKYESTHDNPFIDLSEAWNTYYDSRSRSLKKTVNLATNRLARLGKTTVVRETLVDGRTDELDRVLGDLITISSHSWKSATGTTLDQLGPGSFMRAITAAAALRSELAIWFLCLDGFQSPTSTS